MDAKKPETPTKCGSQNAKAKSKKGRLISRITRLVKQAGLNYDDWRYIAKHVRRKCSLHVGKKPKRLPKVLTADEFRKFYKAVDQADDVQHALILRLMFFTGVRVPVVQGAGPVETAVRWAG
jgi:integrase